MPHADPLHHLLPLHLMMAGGAWQSSRGVLTLLRHGLPKSSGVARHPGLKNARNSEFWEDPRFLDALGEEIDARFAAFLDNVRAYGQAHYHRDVKEAPVVWRGGTATLRFFAPRGKPHAALLLAPSLINRFYVMDLMPDYSFARFLAGQGIAVYVMDWGIPEGVEEAQFSAEDYVSQRLVPAAEWLKTRHARLPLTVAGHCLGGMLTLGLAASRPDLADRLVLFATPWDFSKIPWAGAVHRPVAEVVFTRYLESLDVFPGDHLLTLFYLRDPWLLHDKLERFSVLRGNAQALRHFLALEAWAGDPVPIAVPVMRNAFLDWGLHNRAFEKAWRVDGVTVDPARIRIPVLTVLPQRDRVVPYASARALADRLPDCTMLTPQAGHVSMVAGLRGKQQVWEPMVKWIVGD